MARLRLGTKLLLALFTVTVVLANLAQARARYPRPESTYAFACESLRQQGSTEVNCGGWSRPTVVVTGLLDDLAPSGAMLLGVYYSGEQQVFVNASLSRDEQMSTAAHEQAHYILWETYGEEVGGCESEEAARHVGAQWKGEPYSDEWRLWYGCFPGPKSR